MFRVAQWKSTNTLVADSPADISCNTNSGSCRLESKRMDESKLIRITRPSDGQSLCRTCYWAHAQKGYRESEEVVFCAFGPMRKLPFAVRECTDYLNRTLPTRRDMERIALIIPAEPARKLVGFRSAGFASTPEEEEEVATTTE